MRKKIIITCILVVSLLLSGWLCHAQGANPQESRRTLAEISSMIREETESFRQDLKALNLQLELANSEIERLSKERERESRTQLKEVERLRTLSTELYTSLMSTSEKQSEYLTLLNERDREIAVKEAENKRQRKWNIIWSSLLFGFTFLFVGWRVATKILKHRGIDLPEWLDEIL